MRKTIFLHASLPILLGVLIIVLVINVEEGLLSPHIPHSAYVTHAMKFFDHLGIAFLSLGAIGLLLELPHWHKYFYNLIVDTVSSETYIEKRRSDQKWLEEMQTKLMRAYFGTKDIEKPGGFYSHYREQIQKFIGAPYRNQYVGHTEIQYSPGKPDAFHVKEKISYHCCKLGQNIDKVIGWTARRDELIAMPTFKISLTPQSGFEPKILECNGRPHAELIPDPDGGWGYTTSLESYQGIDGLQIIIELEYVVARDRAFSTNMRSISHGMNWTITYPPDLTIYVDRFVSNESINAEINAGKCVFKYPDWLLPGDGIAFHFRRSEVHSNI